MANTPDEYMAALDEARIPAMTQLRKTILENLPKGFEEVIQYKMISYVVPHSIYPAGYHCDTKQPLPFLALASQKSHIAIYHMGLYMDNCLMDWFVGEYKNATGKEPDMGKSCIRFKKVENIPFNILAELVRKTSVQDWISLYESRLKR